MSQWAKYQPKDGDLILVCGHGGSAHYHWFALNSDDDGNPIPAQFRRPDGSEGEATWACLCDECNTIHLENPATAITSERIWMGDDPFITAPS